MARNKDVLEALKSREKKSLFIPLKCALFECVMSPMLRLTAAWICFIFICGAL